MENKDELFKNFVKDRDELLQKIDNSGCMDDIIKYCMKYYMPMPTNDIAILSGLHKARLQITSKCITDEMKEKSRKWLKEHNMSEEIR